MATQSVEFRAATGLTITAKLFSAGSDTQVASVSATEATNRKGTYTAAYTDVAAGEYLLIAFDSTTPVASWWVRLTLTTATFQVYELIDKDGIADGVYDEAYAGHTTPGTYGFLWDQWRKSNPAITGEVTSAVTPTTTQFSTDITGYANGAFENAVLIFINGSTNADFRSVVSGYVQSNGVVTITPALPQAPVAGDEFTIAIPSFVYTLAQVQSGLATSSGVTAEFTEIKGAGWSSATDTLEEIADAAGGGGGSTVIVSPLSAQSPERVVGTTITTYVGDLSPVTIEVYDADDDPVDLSAQGNLEVCIESRDNVDLQVIAHASITISGASSNKATWTPNSSAVAIVDKHRWSLRTATGKKVLAYGPWIVARAALNDA